MDQWLDSLSEDWVSQPGSPRSDHLRRSSSAFSAVSPANSASQSRIPRPKLRAVSNSADRGVPSRQASVSSTSAGYNKKILKERSSSCLNSARNRETESPAAKRKPPAKQRTTSATSSSVPQDTIQHRTSRVSPAKENDPGDTPEWRRRVLQGKSGAAGPDLFRPIGLESIFKPPTVGRASKAEGKQRRRKKFQPAAIDDFPSSPPAFPSELGSVERSGGTERRRSSLLKQMEMLEEVSEGDSRNTLSEIDTRLRTQNDEPQGGDALRLMSAGPHEEDQNEILSQVALPSREDRQEAQIQDVNPVDLATTPPTPPGSTVNERETSESPQANVPFGISVSSSSGNNVGFPTDDWSSHSLPDDLSTGTDLYAANGGFVNIRRGGYSSEGSFQRRPLSPSSLPDFDAPELRSPSPTGRPHSIRSRKSSTRQGPVTQPRSAPTTPRRKGHTKSNSAEELQSSGSPLKLFDKYDTFTNERLVRRISKFEQSLPESEANFTEEIVDPRSHGKIVIESRIQESPYDSKDIRTQEPKHRLSSFGEGQLDNHSFRIHHHFASNSTSRRISTAEAGYQVNTVQLANGKRPPESPARESRSKRRRTLQSSDEKMKEMPHRSQPIEVSAALHTKVDHDRTGGPLGLSSTSIAGKKRKDARYDGDSKAADPEVLALRQILRPRTATSNQRDISKGTPTRLSLSGVPSNLDGSNDGDQGPAVDLDHETQALAGELATFTLNMAQDISKGDRKPSVTTADFFNEAKEIMKLIRNQGRPSQSGSDIAEEPEDEESQPRRSLCEDSTIDQFSRPPSREGRSLRPLREPAMMDARVASHLRKFEDTDDLGLALPSSAKSMHINLSHDPTVSPGRGSVNKNSDGNSEILSDPPNIRIRPQGSGPTERLGTHQDAKEHPGEASTRIRSSGSQASSGPSTNRSVPTGSSRGSRSSGTRAVIPPQVVSHLLSDNMGGMTFDHKRQAWIKRKVSRTSQGTDTHSRSGSDTTENLFQGIPDLSVDEVHEQRQTRTSTTSIKTSWTTGLSGQTHNPDRIDNEVRDESLRPRTRDSAGIETVDQSSARSKFSHFASSGPVPQTGATSWGEQVLIPHTAKMSILERTENVRAKDDEHHEEVEHEISILEGRASRTPHHARSNQRSARVVTVAFSSPLEDHIETRERNGDPADVDDDESDLDLADSPVRHGAPSPSLSRMRNVPGFGKRSGHRGVSRRASIGFTRPMSRLDENEELAFHGLNLGPSNSGMDLVIRTPLAASRSMLLSSVQSSGIGFQLSPLSEFTVHKDDQVARRDVGQVVRHRGLLARHEVEGAHSLAVQELVKRLTDLEPYEPYWDYIRNVDLSDQNLSSLHMLDDFCRHIEDCDVSNNRLNQLDGAPRSIRQLKARNNCLSDLTSWGHLSNLQYLDISSNELGSLFGLRGLVHLRELRADDNEIESLEGILEMDGLIKVTLRNNRITKVNFEACNLARLTHLDLAHNALDEVAHLDDLSSLECFDASANKLETLCFAGGMRNLQELQLADNQLQTLDIENLPSLRSLNIDRNAVHVISNIGVHSCLDVLSWREQRLSPEYIETGIQYHQCRSVRDLFLSGNTIRIFAPDDDLLNLQHLELASTGLQSLSDDFGLKCPNLRVLNLNFNALTELRPLLGVVRLEQLHLVENRISRLRRTANVLACVGKELGVIDLRQNPLTLGYYVLQQQRRPTAERQLTLASRNENSQVTRHNDAGDGSDGCAYLLPQMDKAADDTSRQRLDEDTKIRRRVYELLVSLRCPKLERLDGLFLDRKKIASKDGVWERLRELGVVTSKSKDGAWELEG
ncbi:MAG: hypothetical protein Q9174_001839 [Haloplaca sp. 1 TL-2023]